MTSKKLKPKSRSSRVPEQATLFNRIIPKVVVVKLDLNYARLAVRVLRGLSAGGGEASTLVMHGDVKQVLTTLADSILEGEKAA